MSHPYRFEYCLKLLFVYWIMTGNKPFARFDSGRVCVHGCRGLHERRSAQHKSSGVRVQVCVECYWQDWGAWKDIKRPLRHLWVSWWIITHMQTHTHAHTHSTSHCCPLRCHGPFTFKSLVFICSHCPHSRVKECGFCGESFFLEVSCSMSDYIWGFTKLEIDLSWLALSDKCKILDLILESYDYSLIGLVWLFCACARPFTKGTINSFHSNVASWKLTLKMGKCMRSNWKFPRRSTGRHSRFSDTHTHTLPYATASIKLQENQICHHTCWRFSWTAPAHHVHTHLHACICTQASTTSYVNKPAPRCLTDTFEMTPSALAIFFFAFPLTPLLAAGVGATL